MIELMIKNLDTEARIETGYKLPTRAKGEILWRMHCASLCNLAKQ